MDALDDALAVAARHRSQPRNLRSFAELAQRPTRQADHEAELAATDRLTLALADAPQSLLDVLVDVARATCRVETAGLSLLEEVAGREVFRWVAVAGRMEPLRGATIPRDDSPCGHALAHGGVLLLRDPADEFPAIRSVDGPLVEALLAPFELDGRAIGTLWVASHESTRQFDREDARLLGRLSRFGSTGVRAHRLNERRQREVARDAFLREVDARLRQAGDAQALESEATGLIGRHLGAAQVGFGEIDPGGEQAVVRSDRGDGRLRSVVGTWRLADFGPAFIRDLEAGAPVAIADLARDPRTSAPPAVDAFAALGIRSTLHVPLVEEGRLVALLFVHHPEPRAWSGEEIAQVAAAADRLWASLQRARVERELRSRDEQLRLFIEHAPAAIAMFDREMRYLAASRRFADDFRLSVTDLVGRSHYELFPDLPERWRAIHRRCLAGATDRHEGEPFPRADGTVDYVRWEIRPWHAADGGIGGLLLFSEVITARVQAEVALRDSEARFRLMADGVPAIIWVTDAQGRIEFVNRAYCELFGVSVEQVRHEGWQPLVHPDDVDAYVGAFVRAQADRQPFHGRARVRTARGEWRWVESHGTPRFSASGEFLGHVGLSPDVTELVEHQFALLEADQRKDRFLATLSHELRNPLAPIRNAAQVLADPRLSATQLQWAQSVIQRQVGHLALLLDDLLDVSRITQGKLTLKKQLVGVGAVVDAAVESVRPLLDRKNHHLVVELPAAPPALEADPVRLAQILANLLNNSAKYTDPGGRIELRASVEDGELVLSVTDDGIGVPPEALPGLFEMFSQAEAAGARSEGGLGIGLALVKGLVELHGGSVRASSEGPGRGTRVTVRLPLPATPVGAGTATAGGPNSAGRRRIVVADDNRDAADSLALLLSLEGHEVRVAYDGRSALTLANAFRPDVAVLDIGMPDLDGHEVARRLRAEPWGDGIVLVALTGWGQDDDRARARDAGFDRHLTKPVDPAQLGGVVATRRR